MKILITGASGFIGRHLTDRLLREGRSVRAVVHAGAQPADFHGRAEVIVEDVRDAGAMKAAAAGVDTVFHLAAKVHDREGGGDHVAAYHAINVEGTRNMLEAAVAGGTKRFVFFSSVKAMGEEPTECRDESWDAVPLTAYGKSKLAAEQLVFEYGQRNNLDVACLRLPLVYGRGVKGNLLRMIEAIDRGLFPPLPRFGNHRSMVHVEDVVQSALLVSETPTARGRCYLVTDGRAYSTRELYVLIRQALGRGIPAWHLPLWALKVAGVAGDAIGSVLGKRCLFDSNALDKLIGSAWYSSERISRELGYRPTHSFEDALPEMIAWYRTAH